MRESAQGPCLLAPIIVDQASSSAVTPPASTFSRTVLGHQLAELVADTLIGRLLFTRLLLARQLIELLTGMACFIFRHGTHRLTREVHALRARPYRLQIPRQMDITRQRASHQLVIPGLVFQQLDMDADLQRPGVALEEGIRIALVPLLEQRMGRRRRLRLRSLLCLRGLALLSLVLLLKLQP